MTSNNQFYLFEMDKVSERDRLNMQHDLLKPHFARVMEQVLAEYGLAKRIETARATGERIQILDVGCGEGWYLLDVAEILQTAGLLDVVDLVGVDIDIDSIYSAEERSRQAGSLYSHLNFYVHDVTRPLETSPDLQLQHWSKFDFIFASAVLEFLPNARQNLQRLYDALKPGGVIYLRSVMTDQSTSNWIAYHPALTEFYRTFYATVAAKNNGLDVASVTADWLREMGAEAVAASKDVVEGNGTTPDGIQMLRIWVKIFRNAGASMVAQNLVSQEEFESLQNLIFRDLGPQSYGTAVYMDTLAQKPA